MWTKDQLISKAFAELAMAGYVYDLSPEVREDALQTLDAMMAEWAGVGVQIGYLMPVTPDDSDIDSDSGIPDAANQAVYMNLAVSLAPGRGKTLTPRTLSTAAQGYSRLLGAAARAAARAVPMPNTMPRGAGNKPWRTGCGNPFFTGPAPTLDADNNDAITT